METVQEVCGFPECNRPTSKTKRGVSRTICGVELCHACFIRFWKTARKKGVTKETLWKKGLPPVNWSRRPRMQCEARGCKTILRKDAPDSERRRIAGLWDVCRPCHMRTWKRAKHKKMTMQRAFRTLPIKNW